MSSPEPTHTWRHLPVAGWKKFILFPSYGPFHGVLQVVQFSRIMQPPEARWMLLVPACIAPPLGYASHSPIQKSNALAAGSSAQGSICPTALLLAVTNR